MLSEEELKSIEARYEHCPNEDIAKLISAVREGKEASKTILQNAYGLYRADAERMREAGVTVHALRKILEEHLDGEITAAKLLDLIRAAAHVVANDGALEQVWERHVARIVANWK